MIHKSKTGFYCDRCGKTFAKDVPKKVLQSHTEKQLCENKLKNNPMVKEGLRLGGVITKIEKTQKEAF